MSSDKHKYSREEALALIFLDSGANVAVEDSSSDDDSLIQPEHCDSSEDEHEHPGPSTSSSQGASAPPPPPPPRSQPSKRITRRRRSLPVALVEEEGESEGEHEHPGPSTSGPHGVSAPPPPPTQPRSQPSKRTAKRREVCLLHSWKRKEKVRMNMSLQGPLAHNAVLNVVLLLPPLQPSHRMEKGGTIERRKTKNLTPSGSCQPGIPVPLLTLQQHGPLWHSSSCF
ncbi:uncharacterized protein LOC125902810 isoform X2 [Epinephelus fuscoguttatus]|uniref:uncharacterized protein LOC125902810 isoform X2 n=1 Tax=Epinephelus fuscoguttatus TaxID=293821 RepID=UPI0020D18A1E|nr:uncharacterized protein LOC125902810 isoform X2 [Epinephelus fuscoguttatus]